MKDMHIDMLNEQACREQEQEEQNALADVRELRGWLTPAPHSTTLVGADTLAELNRALDEYNAANLSE